MREKEAKQDRTNGLTVEEKLVTPAVHTSPHCCGRALSLSLSGMRWSRPGDDRVTFFCRLDF